MIRRTPGAASSAPQVLSVDEFALRTRHTSGTLRLDLERGRPLALLPAREAATVARWLEAHPGGAVVGRDRAEASAEAARLGAPAACQVADRFHLRHHLADVLTQVLTAHAPAWAPLTAQPMADLTPVHDPTCPAAAPEPAAVPLAPPPASPAAARVARQRRTRRWALDPQVWTPHQQGWTLDAIAPPVGRRRRPVQRDSAAPDVSRAPATA